MRLFKRKALALVGTNDLVENTQKYRMAIACGYHIVNEACRCCVSDRSRVLNTQKTCTYRAEN